MASAMRKAETAVAARLKAAHLLAEKEAARMKREAEQAMRKAAAKKAQAKAGREARRVARSLSVAAVEQPPWGASPETQEAGCAPWD